MTVQPPPDGLPAGFTLLAKDVDAIERWEKVSKMDDKTFVAHLSKILGTKLAVPR